VTKLIYTDKFNDAPRILLFFFGGLSCWQGRCRRAAEPKGRRVRHLEKARGVWLAVAIVVSGDGDRKRGQRAMSYWGLRHEGGDCVMH
jgi:hypothetical protein